MAEPTDAILPILQRIQADLRDMKRDQTAHRDETRQNGETLEAIQRYFVYQLGMTTKNEADLETIQNQIKIMEQRIAALEARS